MIIDCEEGCHTFHGDILVVLHRRRRPGSIAQFTTSHEVEIVGLTPKRKTRVLVEPRHIGDLHLLGGLDPRVVVGVGSRDVDFPEWVWTAWIEAELAFPGVKSGELSTAGDENPRSVRDKSCQRWKIGWIDSL